MIANDKGTIIKEVCFKLRGATNINRQGGGGSKKSKNGLEIDKTLGILLFFCIT